MSINRVCIDMSNIVPGKGGSGGGIATYAINLINCLEEICASGEIEIICLQHEDYSGFGHLRNIKVITVKPNLGNPVIRSWWIQVYLPYFCIRNKITLLHRLTPEMPSIKVCKYVCTLHDLMFDFYLANPAVRAFLSKASVAKFLIFRIITKNALKNSSSVIVPSHAIKEEILAKYPTGTEKLKVIYESSEKFASPATNRVKDDHILKMAVIAGFYPHKGHLKVLELAEKLIASGFTGFHVYFRGNPAFLNYVDAIKAVIGQKGLTDYISFVAFQGKANLTDIYNQYNLLLLLSEYEGFGLPVLEAQAYQIPVFCSDIPVFKEILNDSAFFIKKEIDDDVLEHIKRTLTDQGQLDNFIIKGTENLKRFSWQKMSAATYDLYKSEIGLPVVQIAPLH